MYANAHRVLDRGSVTGDVAQMGRGVTRGEQRGQLPPDAAGEGHKIVSPNVCHLTDCLPILLSISVLFTF